MAKRAALQPVLRGHAADAIFDQLAAAILSGEIEANAPLPPERVLGEQFGVSRVVLRQAVHRLADVGLVRVRQGGATMVLDPSEGGDIRLIGLYYALDPGGTHARRIRRDAIEKQSLQGLALIDVCARRATKKEREAIHTLTLGFDDKHATEETYAAFEESFWRAVARAGKNRIFEMETVWWYGVLGDARPIPDAAPPLPVRVAFYRELGRRLEEGRGASSYYLSITTPQLEALFVEIK